MKADLAIYSHAVDAAGQCMSVSLMLGHTVCNLDFSSCDIFVNLVTYMLLSTRNWVDIFMYRFTKFAKQLVKVRT